MRVFLRYFEGLLKYMRQRSYLYGFISFSFCLSFYGIHKHTHTRTHTQACANVLLKTRLVYSSNNLKKKKVYCITTYETKTFVAVLTSRKPVTQPVAHSLHMCVVDLPATSSSVDVAIYFENTYWFRIQHQNRFFQYQRNSYTPVKVVKYSLKIV